MTNERCMVILGQHQGRIWEGTRLRQTEGTPVYVEFDPKWVMDRHQSHHDVIGFYHTHPTFRADPSQLDIDTMQAWVFALGRPLLCVIRGTNGLHGYVFRTDEHKGSHVELMQEFPRRLLIGVEHGKRKSARRKVPRLSRSARQK